MGGLWEANSAGVQKPRFLRIFIAARYNLGQCGSHIALDMKRAPLFKERTMKTFSRVAPLALLLTLGVVALADHHAKNEHPPKHDHAGGDQLAWFDAERCAICEPMAKADNLMQSLEWETHDIDNGMVMVTMVDKPMLEKYQQVCAKMHEKAAKVAAGEVRGAKCCGFCNAFGEVLGSGAKMQQVNTGFGQITIVTADDPAVVEKIHAMSAKTQAEMKKMAPAAG